MQVSELLSRKGADVVTVGAEATIDTAVALLVEHKIGALVVSPDGRVVEGILSERDVVRALNEFGARVGAESVASVMSAGVHSCSPGDTVESLMAIMTNKRIRHLPVVEDGVLVGMVSIGDVVKTRMDELEHDREALMDYISAR